MDAAAPTTPPSDSSSLDYSDSEPSDNAAQVLSNATLLKAILQFHTELRVRMVAVHVEHTPQARLNNQTVQRAMECIQGTIPKHTTRL